MLTAMASAATRKAALHLVMVGRDVQASLAAVAGRPGHEM
jgi:hypothetical protein